MTKHPKLKKNPMRSKNILLTLLLTGILLSGCAFPLFSQPTAIVIPTSMIIVPATLEPTASPTVIPTPTPYHPINAVVGVNIFIVRTGPGKVFPVLRTYPENTILTVLGQAPGNGEWVLVQTPDHLSAWAMVEYIDIQGDLRTIPYIEPPDVYKVSGRVLDAENQPIRGIIFAIWQGTGENEVRTEAETDANGIFMGYLPTTVAGTWNVSWVSLSCQRASIVDAECHYSGSVQPNHQFITLPLASSLNFTWK
jgi:hypothetical protein